MREIIDNTVFNYFKNNELRIVADMNTAEEDGNPLSADMYFVGIDIARIMGCSSMVLPGQISSLVSFHQKHGNFMPEGGYLDVRCKNGTIRKMRAIDFKAAISMICSDPEQCLPLEDRMALIEYLCHLAKKYNI